MNAGGGGANGPIRVLLVENNEVFLKGLSQLLEFQEDLSVCGAAGGIREALRLIGKRRPDIVIVDITLGAENGIDLVRKIAKGGPPVIVLSMHDEPYFAGRAIKAGAMGYVNKQEAPETIVKAIRGVLDGGTFVSAPARDFPN